MGLYRRSDMHGFLPSILRIPIFGCPLPGPNTKACRRNGLIGYNLDQHLFWNLAYCLSCLASNIQVTLERSRGPHQSTQLDLAFCLRQSVSLRPVLVAGRKHSMLEIVSLYGRSDTHGVFCHIVIGYFLPATSRYTTCVLASY